MIATSEHAEQVGRLTLTLPVPPSLNEMIGLAKKRTRRTRNGGFMKRSLPVVYDQHLEAYHMRCEAAVREAKIRPPAEPWKRWRMTEARFYLHNLRDWTELLASLKWPVDYLVHAGFVADDSPREMEPPPVPEQAIDRSAPRILLTVEEIQE